jgi:hypothetical protein
VFCRSLSFLFWSLYVLPPIYGFGLPLYIFKPFLINLWIASNYGKKKRKLLSINHLIQYEFSYLQITVNLHKTSYHRICIEYLSWFTKFQPM